MLLGTFAPKLDDKGRIVLPAKFWDEFSGGLVMTRGQEHCVYLFSQREFENVHDRIRQASLTSKASRNFLRLFLSGATQEIPDKQRRVTVPTMLRDYAGLDRELTVIGTGTRAEIWDTAAWNAYYAETEAEFADTDEEVIAGLF
ncbi:division/cell wall cluster transcriptional repressor MraZ [Homoserinibacter sp. YIM 151385]|uniref:division/cell wall cluster transcriptional repressor MraZ n=1 Tax=Homoserinibacter sp. YIM 151385 TaxID=2985506 RepID=UPI0022F096BF|nr:division/cell wall cluster transcriptional repressor MraZ [Homoserinibacter sp. YIM 151385]WBU38748.1 division/cell wall cluster transcriptional repressor MraZ [Homoserinibacter sp. YIM 151385]